MDRTRENYEELLTARALGALTEAEVAELEAAIDGDAELRATAREMDEAATLLALSVEPITPPAAVRNNILGSIRIGTAAPRRIEPATEKVAENVVEFPGRAAGRRRDWRTQFVGIAAVLIIAVLGVAVWMINRRANESAADNARLNQRLQQVEQDLNRERELRAMLASPDANLVALNGTNVTPAANAKFIYDRRTGRGMLMADKLPVPPAGKAYQLWYIVDGRPPIPAEVFKPDAGGHGEMKTMVPPESRGKATLAVTLENEGGAASPQGQMYLKGDAS
jgi:anti-sigma-K factor RskA